MLIRILGIADILSILALVLSSILHPSVTIIMALYLITKGIIFSLMGNTLSLIDSLIGFYILIAAFGILHWIPTLIITVYILQKAIPSAFA